MVVGVDELAQNGVPRADRRHVRCERPRSSRPSSPVRPISKLFQLPQQHRQIFEHPFVLVAVDAVDDEEDEDPGELILYHPRAHRHRRDSVDEDEEVLVGVVVAAVAHRKGGVADGGAHDQQL